MLLALGAVPSRAATIEGYVFEDVSYGGGAGRSRVASAGIGVPNVRVEIYTSGGTYLGAVTTDNTGFYQYTYSGHSTRRVRIVNGTVASRRTGGTSCTGCVPVQTFRDEAPDGDSIAITDEIGGRNPALIDYPARSSGFPGNSSTQTMQSWSYVDPDSGSSTVNIDFGFNFSTIVSTRDAASCTPTDSGTSYPCQGTLRQFLINAFALGTPSSQVGQPGGYETSIFMIPTTGVATITLATALPAIAEANLRLDATTQTTSIGNTNPGQSGSGGTVGVQNISFPRFNRPEIEIPGAILNCTGLNQTVQGFALPRGSINMSGANAVVRENFVGIAANGTPDSGSDMAIVFTGANAQITGNYAAANNSVIRGDSPGAGAVVSYNEVIRSSATPTNTFDGILLIGNGSNARIENNLARNQAGAGIELGFSGGTMSNVVIVNNTVRQNGFAGSGATPGTTPSSEPVGIAAWNYTGSNVDISLNRIEGNAGPGIMLSQVSGTRLSQNEFSNNGGLSVDLYPTSTDPNSMGTTFNGPTLNDNGDGDVGANGLLNFPVITAATIANGEFSVAGFARPGSTIELYVAQPDPAGFGEGLTYLGSFTEGVNDLDNTTGSYSGAINGRNQGSDTTNRFLFRSSTIPAGISAGTVLTSTATLAFQTSEFGGNVTVTGGPGLVHTKTVQVESDPFNNTTNPKRIPGSVQLYTIRIANQAAGTVDNNSIDVIDEIPANTMMCGLTSTPVTFQQGSPTSGLTFNPATNVSYSSAAGTPVWGYTPVPDANGCDPAIRHLRMSPRGTMAGAGGSGNPYFELRFRVRVR